MSVEALTGNAAAVASCLLLGENGLSSDTPRGLSLALFGSPTD
jgi:hypothetical protein